MQQQMHQSTRPKPLIKLVFDGKRKLIHSQNNVLLGDLVASFCKSFSGLQKMDFSEKFVIYFIDPQLDYVQIESQDDWDSVQHVATSVFKLSIIHLVALYRLEVALFQNHSFVQSFVRAILEKQEMAQKYKKEQERLKMKQCRLIIREQFRYRLEIEYGGIKLYRCEDFKNQGCKAIWRIPNAADEKGELHVDHSILMENHTYYREMNNLKNMDVTLYNTCFQNYHYEERKKPVLTDETHFLLNVIKGAYKQNLNYEKADLIFDICKNNAVAEVWSKFYNLGDWLLMEAKQQVIREMPKNEKLPEKFVDPLAIKTYTGTLFGRGIAEELFLGQSKHLLYFMSEWQEHIFNTRGDLKLPLVVMVDNFLKIRTSPPCDYSMVINLLVYDYTKEQFVTFGHCLSQTERPEAVVQCLAWFKDEIQYFNPAMFVIEADTALFDAIHNLHSS